MRLFISIQLDKNLRDALDEFRGSLRLAGVRGSYTRTENLHLTLAFIGEHPDPDEVLEALQTVAFRPFELALEGCGSFGDLWWVGTDDSPALEAAARRVRRVLAEAGIPFDRKRFVPHITVLRRAELGRSGLPKGGGQPAGGSGGIDKGGSLRCSALQALTVPSARMTVRRISLMRSDRGKSGMIYTELGAVEAEE